MSAAFLLDAARVAYYVYEIYRDKKSKPSRPRRPPRSSKRTRRQKAHLKPAAEPEKPLDLASIGFTNSLLVNIWYYVLNPSAAGTTSIVPYRPTSWDPPTTTAPRRDTSILVTQQELDIIAPVLYLIRLAPRPVFPLDLVQYAPPPDTALNVEPSISQVSFTSGALIVYSPPLTWYPIESKQSSPCLKVIGATYKLLDAIRLNSSIPPSLIYHGGHYTELPEVSTHKVNEVSLNSETGALVLYQPLFNWSPPRPICDTPMPSLPLELFYPRQVFVPSGVHLDPMEREIFSLNSRSGAVVLYAPPLRFIFEEPSLHHQVSPLKADASNLVFLTPAPMLLLPAAPMLLPVSHADFPNKPSSPTLSLILMLAGKQKYEQVTRPSKALILYRPLTWPASMSTPTPLAEVDIPRPSTKLILMLARKAVKSVRFPEHTAQLVGVKPPVVPETPVVAPKRRSRPVPQAQFLRNLVINQHKSNNKPSPSRTPVSAHPQSTPKKGESAVERPALSGGVLLGVPGRSRPPATADQKKENTAGKAPVTPTPRQGHNKRRRPGPDIASTPSRK